MNKKTTGAGGFINGLRAQRISTGIVAILLGLLFITMPATSAEVICTVCGILFLIAGVVAVLYHIFRGVLFSDGSLLIGVIFVVIGLLCLLNASFVIDSLAIILGIFVIVDGAVTLGNAIACAKAKIAGWPALLVMAIIVIVLGALIMTNLFDAIMVLIGIALLADGIFDIAIVIIFSRKIKAAKEALEQLAGEFDKRKNRGDVIEAEVIEVEAIEPVDTENEK